MKKNLFKELGGIQSKNVKKNSESNKNHHALKKILIIAAASVLVLTSVVILPLSSVFGAKDDVVYPKAYAYNDYDAKEKVKNDNPVSEDFIKSVNDFGYKSAAAVLDGKKNGNFSPIALYYPLALAKTGAAGDTANEMTEALGIKNSDTFSKDCGSLYRNLYFDNNIGTFRIANSLWMNKGDTFNEKFTQNAKENFYASTHNVSLNSNSAKRAMSTWVRDNTKGTLAPKIDSDADTRLVILNSVYFKDQWADKFEKSKTRDDTFTKADGGKVTASFLNDQRSTGFYKGENFSRSSLLLRNAGEMVFVLPDEGTSPADILKSKEALMNAFEGGKDSECIVNWKIPKFKFNSDYELKENLKKLGVTSALEDNANFGGMTASLPTFIGNVHQGSYIALNEDGVEASAYVELFMCGAAPPPPEIKDMYLTRPFLYGIYSENGTLLFIGVVENPA